MKTVTISLYKITRVKLYTQLKKKLKGEQFYKCVKYMLKA